MRPKVVICGSYHRELATLRRIFRELEATGVRILSPISLEFKNFNQPIVKTEHELGFSLHEIEKFHLRAMRESDFIWLHAPGGYVGTSGSFELGYAVAINKPIYTFEEPEDLVLKSEVTIVRSVFEALEISF